jgi:hypothetical protein
MISKQTMVAIVLAAALTFNVVTPSPARALDTVSLVFISIGSYVALVTVGALLTTHRANPLFMQETLPEQRDPLARTQQDGIHFGMQCRPTADGRPLLCW